MEARTETAFKSILADQICGENSLQLSYLEEMALADPDASSHFYLPP